MFYMNLSRSLLIGTALILGCACDPQPPQPVPGPYEGYEPRMVSAMAAAEAVDLCEVGWAWLVNYNDATPASAYVHARCIDSLNGRSDITSTDLCDDEIGRCEDTFPNESFAQTVCQDAVDYYLGCDSMIAPLLTPNGRRSYFAEHGLCKLS